jgi:hypothetical protein
MILKMSARIQWRLAMTVWRLPVTKLLPILLAIPLLLAARVDASETGTLIGKDWNYLVANARNGNTATTGNLLNDIKVPPELKTQFDTIKAEFLRIAKVIPDLGRGRLFIELAYPRSNTIYGYAVISYPKFELQRVIHGLDMDSADILISPRSGDVYLSFIVTGSKTGDSETEVFDSKDWKPRKLAHSLANLSRACFEEDGKAIYSQGTTYSSRDGSQIAKTKGNETSMMIGCDGTNSFWVSREDNQAVLIKESLDSAKPQTVVHSADALPFFDSRDWALSPGANYAARLVAKSVDGRLTVTGQVSIFNIRKATSSDVTLPNSTGKLPAQHRAVWKIVFGNQEDRLIVIGGDQVFVVDTEKGTIDHSMQTPFVPIGVVWP